MRTGTKDDGKPFIHPIPNNGIWPNGIPPVMGAHLMASGTVAPISTSKGPGLDVAPPPFEYHNVETDASVVLHTTAASATSGLTKMVVEAAEVAVKAKGVFTLVLSGGSLPSLLAGLAGARGVQWDKWHVFYVDERNVPHGDADSTHRAVREALLSKVPIPEGQVHAIHEGLPVEQAATEYAGRLMALPASALPRTADSFPVFDLILLGLGPDGHVASLFPNRPEVAETKAWVLPVKNSPKPPPERITMTLPVINSAKEVVFVALGEGKAEVVQRTLEVQALPGALPAQMVRPTAGRARWLLDVASAQKLDIAHWGEPKLFPRSQ